MGHGVCSDQRIAAKATAPVWRDAWDDGAKAEQDESDGDDGVSDPTVDDSLCFEIAEAVTKEIASAQ